MTPADVTPALVVLGLIIGVNVVVSLLGFRVFRSDAEAGGRAEAFLFIPYRVAQGENGLGMLLAHFAHGGRLHRGGISHEGHLGGAVIGLALTGVLAPRGLSPLIRWFTQWAP